MKDLEEFLQHSDEWCSRQAGQAQRIAEGVAEGSITQQQGRQLMDNLVRTQAVKSAARGNQTRTRLLAALQIMARTL